MPNIYYAYSNPEKIVCVGDTYESDEPFGSFKYNAAVSVTTHKIIWSDNTPTITQRSVDDLAAEQLELAKSAALYFKLDEIDTKCNSLLSDGNLFVYGDYHYHIDRDSFTAAHLIIDLIDWGSYPADFTISWKTGDKNEVDLVNNIYTTLDQDGLKGLLAAFATHSLKVWGIGDTHKKAVKLLRLQSTSTATDIENYDHTSGWI